MLSHPNIGHLIDAGVTEIGQPYLVLEYVNGETIVQYCKSKQLLADDCIRLFLDVLAPVAHAHANLIVHRDLKPSNVLVTTSGQVKLLDFGIAKLLTDQPSPAVTQITRDAGGALTPAYAAPEQLTGGLVTTTTDVYSLGVLLYVLLAGRHPFADALGSPASLLHATTALEPPPLGLGSDIDLIVAKTLKKAPDERYGSVVELADDLRRYLNHEPVSARPDSLSYRAAKFVRRNRVAVSLSALVVLALVAGLVGTITQARRATEQATLAAGERDVAMRPLARAEAMNDLNQFVLTEAVPSGMSFTVSELLARAETAVARQHAHDPETQVDMMVAIGRQYWTQDRYDDARRVLAAAYAIAGSIEDPGAKARSACALGSATAKFGDAERAAALVEEGLAQLPEQPQYTLARVFCHLRAAENAREFDDSAAAVARAELADQLVTASSIGTPLLRLRVLLDLAESYRVASRGREADKAFSRALPQLTALGYDQTETAETLFNNWALVLWELGRPRDSEALYRRAIAGSSVDGSDARVSPLVFNNLARTLIDLARYAEGLQFATRAYEKAHAVGNPVVVMQSLFVRAQAHRQLDQLPQAEAILAEIESRAAGVWGDGHPGLISLALERAALATARGDIDAALTHVNEACAAAERTGDHYPISRTVLRRAALLVRKGEAESARADAERVLRLFQDVAQDGKSLLVARAAVIHARALQLLGRDAEGRRQLALAADHFVVVDRDHPEAREALELAARVR